MCYKQSVAKVRSLYEKVLERIGDEGVPVSSRPPRASAGVVPWRRRGSRIEVFWIRRSDQLAFMGGWHAFPGGGWSRLDPEVPLPGIPRGVDGAPIDAALPVGVLDGFELGPILPPGLAATALRELFEETGLLPVVGAAPRVEELEAARQQLVRGETEFVPLVERLGVELDVSRLVYAGRWITPPFGPVRFDNRFFLLEWSPEENLQPTIVEGEIAEGEWIEPSSAIARWKDDGLITAPPILHILEVLATDGPQAGLDRLREPREANLGPYRRIEFRPGVLLLPLPTPTLPPAATTNCYVLGTGKTVVVDPGTPFANELEWLIESIEAQRRALGRTPSAIWLTHHHPDHVGGVEALRQALKVPVCAHRATAERLEEIGIAVDEELRDGQVVELDGDPAISVSIVHTPGHARGHLCFFDQRYGSLIAGDLVAGLGTIVIDPPEGDMGDYLRSLQRVIDLKPATLFPAHGPTIKHADAKLSEYLHHRRWREERVRRVWDSGLRIPAEMVAQVYDDIPEAAIPLAERQIVAHLDHLREHGALAQG